MTPVEASAGEFFCSFGDPSPGTAGVYLVGYKDKRPQRACDQRGVRGLRRILRMRRISCPGTSSQGQGPCRKRRQAAVPVGVS